MSTTGIAELTAITTGAIQSDDILVMVDVHDTAQAAQGSTRKTTLANLYQTNTTAVTVSTPLPNIAQTWNNAAIAFTGVLLNITNTASAAASLLIDLQVGGVSQFKVTKAGAVTTVGAATHGGALTVTTGGAAITGTVAVTGAATVSTTLDVTGAFTAGGIVVSGGNFLVNAGGLIALGAAAISLTTFLNIPAATTAGSCLRLAHGAAPTAPVNGDMWTTTAGLYVRINGATVGPLT